MGVEYGEEEIIGSGSPRFRAYEPGCSYCAFAISAMLAIEHGHRTGLAEEQAAQSPFPVFRWWVSTRWMPPSWVDMNQMALRIWSGSSLGVSTFIVERLSQVSVLIRRWRMSGTSAGT